MKHERDSITLSTGRECYIYAGIIGLGIDLRVHYGYDGDIDCWPREWMEDEGWTPEERRELADHMIALWQKFRDASEPEPEEASNEG